MVQRSRKNRPLDGPVSVDDAAIIVAHPDDELLWAGGLLLEVKAAWRVMTLCRASDRDRAPRFQAVMQRLGARGIMADLDDGPEQQPLDPAQVESAIVDALRGARFDLVVTHGPNGEYTRHRRHEEVCRAVVRLWLTGRLQADRLWMCAYHDDGGRRLPTADPSADRWVTLSGDTWRQKYALLTEVYGFARDSWEAQVTPQAEAFWCFDRPEQASAWIETQEPRA